MQAESEDGRVGYVYLGRLVILDPINDVDCLSQLTTIVRELSSTTLIHTVAQHLGSREAVIRWLQSKPQVLLCLSS